MSDTCYNCFLEKPDAGSCPHCGYDSSGEAGKYPLALKQGAILNGRYTVGRVLGQGGFGITYLAQDYQTRERVAIKEYLPTEFVGRTQGTYAVQVYSGDRRENFEYGKTQFLNEAKTLAQVQGNEHIVRVFRYFEENNTAYFVMEYVDGPNLDEYMKEKGGRLSPEDACRLLLPVMEAMDWVHQKGIVHRDIAPDNILIARNGCAKILDFGAARYSTGEKSKSLDVILKHGYAPKEQYQRHGRQGPFTDVYAMAATFYHTITGKTPPDAIDRLEDDALIPPTTLGIRISDEAEEVLYKALEVAAIDRFQSMGQFAAELKAAVGADVESTATVAQDQRETPEIHPVSGIGEMTSVPIAEDFPSEPSSGDETLLSAEKDVPTIPGTAGIPSVSNSADVPPSSDSSDLPSSESAASISGGNRKKTPLNKKFIIAAVAAAFLLMAGLGATAERIARNRKTSSPQAAQESIQQSEQTVPDSVSDTAPSIGSEDVSAAQENHIAVDSEEFRAMQKANAHTIAAGWDVAARIRTDGTVSVISAPDVTWTSYDSVEEWTDIVSIDAGFDHLFGLKSDGTVVFAGAKSYGEDWCDVSSWTDIVAIACGPHHVLGLRANGTVLAVGDSSDYWVKNTDLCDVSNWSDIKAVGASAMVSMGVKTDGSVAVKGDLSYNPYQGWKDIVSVAGEYQFMIGLDKDGIVCAGGRNLDLSCPAVGIAGTDFESIVLMEDGTVTHVVGTAPEDYVSPYDYSDGIRIDTTTGWDRYMPFWTDIVEVDASTAGNGLGYVLALKSDGTVVATGSPESGIGEFSLILLNN